MRKYIVFWKSNSVPFFQMSQEYFDRVSYIKRHYESLSASQLTDRNYSIKTNRVISHETPAEFLQFLDKVYIV